MLQKPFCLFVKFQNESKDIKNNHKLFMIEQTSTFGVFVINQIVKNIFLILLYHMLLIKYETVHPDTRVLF